MDFAIVVVAATLFFVGLVLVFQGIVGKEVNPAGQWLAMRPYDLDQPGIDHPPERHRVRLVAIGLAVAGAGVLVAAVGL